MDVPFAFFLILLTPLAGSFPLTQADSALKMEVSGMESIEECRSEGEKSKSRDSEIVFTCLGYNAFMEWMQVLEQNGIN